MIIDQTFLYIFFYDSNEWYQKIIDILYCDIKIKAYEIYE